MIPADTWGIVGAAPALAAPSSQQGGFTFESALADALRHPCVVLLFTCWQPELTPLCEVLRFQLMAAGKYPWASLNASWSVVPFGPYDRRQIQAPNLAAEHVWETRREARLARRARSVHPLDLRELDWELAYRRNRAALRDTRLGLGDFLPIDRVRRNGEVEQGTRSVLGAKCSRSELRLGLLVPAFGVSNETVAAVLVRSEHLLIDLQALRAPTAAGIASCVARLRQAQGGMILLAQSPSEVMSFFTLSGIRPSYSIAVGAPPQSPILETATVGRDRLQREREFEATIAPLEPMGEGLKSLIDQVRHAWWEANQLLRSGQARPAFDQLERSLHALTAASPSTARLFNAARRLVNDTAAGSHVAERLSVSVELLHRALNADQRVLVLTRSSQMADGFRQAFAEQWACDVSELSAFGVRVTPSYPEQVRGASEDVVLVTGFFGAQCLDAILAARAPRVVWLLDPVEARAAYHLTSRYIQALERARLESVTPVLKSMLEALEPLLVPETESVVLRLDAAEPSRGERLRITERASGRTKQDNRIVAVWLSDGTVLEVHPERRFDVLDNVRMAIERVGADQLLPGDQVVVVHGDYQRTLAELLLEVLDNGPLKQFATQRKIWLVLVNQAAASLNIAEITRRLESRGFFLDRQTVRLWVMRDSDGLSRRNAPRSRAEFHAFAAALELLLPTDYLDQLYESIRKWRVGHRVAGRLLVRVMCAAALGRLDVRTVDRIRGEWGGLDISDLLEGARVVSVDHIDIGVAE